MLKPPTSHGRIPCWPGGRLLGAPAPDDLAAPRLFGLRHQRGALRLGRRRCALAAVVPRAVEREFEWKEKPWSYGVFMGQKTMKWSFFFDFTFKAMGIWLMNGGLMIVGDSTTFKIFEMIIIHELGMYLMDWQCWEITYQGRFSWAVHMEANGGFSSHG